MNRQIIAFLSLFSLVLVLSVYYVLVPTAPEATPVNIGYESRRDAFFTTLLIQKESIQLEEINRLSLIVSSVDVSGEDKALASAGIDIVRETMQIEQECAMLIKEEGFQASFVQIKNEGTTIIVSNGGVIENIQYVRIFDIALTNGLKNPVVYNYDNPPATLISDI